MLNKESALCPILVGRASQLDSLIHLLHQAKDGKGQIALISGEAGIGKSRLILEAKAIGQEMGFSILEGHCFESEQAFAYAPLTDLLRGFYTAHSTAEAAESMGRATSELARLLPELEGLLPTLEAPLPAAEPEEPKRRLFEAMLRLLLGRAAIQPRMIIIEDLHWSDENSLDFLHYLARRMRGQAILLVLTLRAQEASLRQNHFLATLMRESQPLEIALTPLDLNQVEEMIRQILGPEQHVRADFAARVHRLTEGNPFYVEEVLKSLLASGQISMTENQENLKSGGELHIPLSIQETVQRRMHGLDSQAQRTLSMAAVIGQRFDFALLQEITTSNEQQLVEILKDGIASQLIIENSADQYSFRHALTRESVYAAIMQRERRKYHRMIAEALEDMPASSVRNRAGALAQHYYEAGVWNKAMQHAEQAGQRAQNLYAPAEAAQYFTQAINSIQRLGGTPAAHLHRQRGQAYETLGNFEGARLDYEQALGYAEQAHDSTAAWQSLIALGLLWAGRDYRLTGKYLDRALELAGQIAEPILQARSLDRLGNWFLNTGRFEEGLQAHSEALSIFEEQHDRQGMAETLDLLGTAYGMQGDRIRAAEHIRHAIEQFKELGDARGMVSSLAMLALQSMPGACETTYSPLRSRDECVQDATEAMRLARQIEWPGGQAFAENALAHTLLSFGEFGLALSHAQEAQHIARDINHQQWIVATQQCIGHLFLLLLAPTPAIEALQAAAERARELGSFFWVATISAKLGRAYILNRNIPAAEATLRAVMEPHQQPRNVAERDVCLAWGELLLKREEPAAALEIAEQLLSSVPGGPPGQPVPHLLKLKGDALLELSNADQAVEALVPARRGAESRNALPLLWTIHRSLAKAYASLHRHDRAAEEQAAARALIEKIALSIDDEAPRGNFQRAALASLPKLKKLTARDPAKQTFDGLTAREREIAALIAEGNTSRQIAELLVISERTVEAHAGSILRKLGFHSRAQVAVWASEKGLVKSAR